MDEEERIIRRNILAEINSCYDEIRRFSLRYGRKHRDSTQTEFYRRLCSFQNLRNSSGYREALLSMDTEGLLRYRDMVRGFLSSLKGNRINNVSSTNVAIRENDIQADGNARGNPYKEHIQRQVEMQVFKRNSLWDIYAIKSGTVVATTNASESDYGNSLLIKDSDGIVARYAHLVGLQLNVGSVVLEGQVIGVMGDTGTTNKHLHVSVYPVGTLAPYWSNDAKINPVNYIKEGTYPANTYISTPFGTIGPDWPSGIHDGTDFSGINDNVIPDWSHGITGVVGIDANNNRKKE